MKFSNYHTHCRFCHGSSEPEDYIKQAVKMGLDAIGFSSHSPMPFENTWAMREKDVLVYCNTINRLKKKYKDLIQVYLGMEVECISKFRSMDKYKLFGLDYTIGSNHLIIDDKSNKYMEIDDSEEEYRNIIDNVFDSDIKKFVSTYYDMVCNTVTEYKPTIVGHLDLIKKNNKNCRYFNEDEEWYKAQVLKTLNVIAKSQSILEVNTGGISRGYISTTYPALNTLIECRKLDIPVTISSDAHEPQNINAFFEVAVSVLKEAGYRKQSILYDGVWIEQNI